MWEIDGPVPVFTNLLSMLNPSEVRNSTLGANLSGNHSSEARNASQWDVMSRQLRPRKIHGFPKKRREGGNPKYTPLERIKQ